MIFLPKTPQESNREETSDKSKLRDSLQTNWPVMLKSVKIMKISLKSVFETECHLKDLKTKKWQCIILHWMLLLQRTLVTVTNGEI